MELGILFRCWPPPLFIAALAHAVDVVSTVSIAVTALVPLTVVFAMMKHAFATLGLLVTFHEIVPV
jgi:hypothetical protein